MPSFWPWLPLLAAAHTYLAWRRLLAYLRYFQQEGYEQLRFLRWTNVRSLTDPAFWLSLGCGISVAGWRREPRAMVFLVGAVLLGLAQPDPAPVGQDPAEAHVARDARADGGAWSWRRPAGFCSTQRCTPTADLQAPLIASAIVFALLPLRA